jgi:hypothetical protein
LNCKTRGQDTLSWTISVTTFNRENALESSGKMERENPFLNYWLDSFHLMAEKWWWDYKIRILYAKRNQSKTRTTRDWCIKEYGEFIPLMKGKMISASQLLERFLLMLKTIRFCGSFKRGELKRLYLCTVLIQNQTWFSMSLQMI